MPKKWPRDYGEGHIIDETTDDDASASREALTSTVDGGQNHGSTSVYPSHTDRSPLHGANNEASISSWPVALYIPNLLGYLRIILSFYGLKHALQQHPHKALNIWISAALLDLIDGVAARMLNQCSQFGILLDIASDNILRTIVWISSMIECSKSDSTRMEIEICIWASIIFLEWITMFCSQGKQKEDNDNDNAHWKDFEKKESSSIQNNKPPPFWVQAVFKNNFRSPTGIFAIYGLFAAPVGTYVWYADRLLKVTWPSRLLSEDIISILIKMAYAGRFLSAMVEMWICYDYLGGVIARDKRMQSLKKVKDS